ncbi:MAG: D-alanine--D-alanine ligase [Solobacterium sp.]|nr:D-alanine--D-alanine ligase [Solobacterium sp.]
MKLNVGVFFGGESVEHEVSIISAHQAMNALNKDKYNVIPIYVAKDRKLYSSPLLEDMSNFKDLTGLLNKCTQVNLYQADNHVVIHPVQKSLFSKKDLGTLDLAIPVMHGTNGEDGTIQGFFEMLKLPYAGCDLIAAAVGQDKVLQKHTLENSGLPVTPWFWVYSEEFESKRDEILERVHKIGYPVILKPACTGSSVGISIAHNDAEYIECFEDAGQYDAKVITEQVVAPMREMNCSVIGEPFQARASAIEEVFHGADTDFLDFKDKYQGGSKGSAKSSGSKGMASVSRLVNPDLPEETTRTIQSLALETFRVLGSSGVCRIDFMMNADSGEVYVNEINTIPGSLAFYLWEASGLHFSELMDQLVDLTLTRERRRSRMTYSYDTNLLSTYTESSGAKSAKGAKR